MPHDLRLNQPGELEQQMRKQHQTTRLENFLFQIRFRVTHPHTPDFGNPIILDFTPPVQNRKG